MINELEPGHFALNVLGEQLRTGVPESVRNLALTFGSETSRGHRASCATAYGLARLRCDMSLGWTPLSISPHTTTGPPNALFRSERRLAG